MKRTALGLGVAITAGFALIIHWLLADNRLFLENRVTISAVLGALGLLAVALGVARACMRHVREGKSPTKLAGREVFPLVSLFFWGVQLLLCAALVQLVIPTPELVRLAGKSRVLASSLSRLSRIGTAAEPEEPKLRLQGILLEPQEDRASAIINGQRVKVGDEVNGSKVLAIRRSGVEITNLEGVELLEIRDWRLARVKTNDAAR
jgi:hypothetical protein